MEHIRGAARSSKIREEPGGQRVRSALRATDIRKRGFFNAKTHFAH